MAEVKAAAAAWELLAEQPRSISKLSVIERHALVISAVTQADGKELVVSRYGDGCWDLTPHIHSPGLSDVDKFIGWSEHLPVALIADAKAVCYAWKQAGRPGVHPPSWHTVRVQAVMMLALIRWLSALGIERFDQVQPIHLSTYMHHCKSELALGGRGLRSRLESVDLLWVFRKEVGHPLTFEPWQKDSLWKLTGGTSFETAATSIIPREVQERVYNYCTAVLDAAEPILIRLERGELRHSEPEALRIRDCVLYIVMITTGMRNDEVLRVESGASREETVAGVRRRWVKSVEQKTRKGLVEYLCPEITGRALAVLERYVAPLQQRLARELRELESAPPTSKSELRMMKIRADVGRVFLCSEMQRRSIIKVLSTNACRGALDRIAKAAGVDWKLTCHQTRRTYARMVVESQMGRASLVFLKWQLKHTSMAMTQGYASNPIADRSLVDDFITEMRLFKGELLEIWTGDAPLSGGAGRAMIQLRATAHKDREALLKSAAEHVHIRATGHGWCLAQDSGCGGAGLYEATRCVDCKSGVIDPSFAETWLEIHSQQKELLDLEDVGPAVRKRALREVRLAGKVLEDLGLLPATEA